MLHREKTLSRYCLVLTSLQDKKTVSKSELASIAKEAKTNNNIGMALIRLGYLKPLEDGRYAYQNNHVQKELIAVSVNKWLNRQAKSYTKNPPKDKKKVTAVSEMPDDYFIGILKERGYKISKEITKYF